MLKEPDHNAIALENLEFGWKPDRTDIRIDQFVIQPGEKVLLVGPSGSGKSTLLNVMAGLLEAQSGKVAINGHTMTGRSAAERDRLRADHMGFIFQSFNLLPFLSLVDNVKMSCRFSKVRKQKAIERYGSVDSAAHQLLTDLGLQAALNRNLTVSELSVGQQQRVAIARALIGNPSLLLADEPTSALDSVSQNRFMDLLIQQCNTSSGSSLSLLVVSHDLDIAPFFDRVVSLSEINQTVSSMEKSDAE
jgi:putative ABC transport system ATP-binding protein